MSVREILKMGDSRLLQPAVEVCDVHTAEIKMLVEDMRDTMRERAGLGLAAPQIGVSLRVIIFGFKDNPRYPDVAEVAQTVLVNPEISVLDASLVYGWEACLSLPGLRGRVPRFSKIRYTGFAADGSRIEREAEGFHARVVQHECDHLDGVLYPMRMDDMRDFGFEDTLDL